MAQAPPDCEPCAYYNEKRPAVAFLGMDHTPVCQWHNGKTLWSQPVPVTAHAAALAVEIAAALIEEEEDEYVEEDEYQVSVPLTLFGGSPEEIAQKVMGYLAEENSWSFTLTRVNDGSSWWYDPDGDPQLTESAF